MAKLINYFLFHRFIACFTLYFLSSLKKSDSNINCYCKYFKLEDPNRVQYKESWITDNFPEREANILQTDEDLRVMLEDLHNR